MTNSLHPQIELIQSDKRGAMYQVILPNGEKGKLIFTKKGYYRGGHFHNVAETTMVLSGKLKYIFPAILDFDVEKVLLPGEIQHNEPGEVHLGYFEEDTWILDWQITPPGVEIITTNVPKYRKFVDDQMNG